MTARLGCFMLLVVGAIVAGCGSPSPEPTVLIDDPAELDDLHLDLPFVDPTTWVQLYDPQRCANGYNLVLYRRNVPLLIDMNGAIVHAWPRVRAVGRARLSTQGALAVIGRDDYVKEYDWDGKLLWYYRVEPEADFPHHDFIRLSNGNFLLLLRCDADGTDYLQEVDRKQRVVWEWRSADYLDREFPSWDRTRKDSVHMNSVHELPPNHWADEGDERFRPGNILVSARNLNCIFIIDRKTGDIVWRYQELLDYQHEALMVREGLPGAGLVVFFNNGYNNLHAYRRSTVMAIDPTTEEVVWQYDHQGFFSAVAGSQVVLPNGNVLISSSEGGRAFEITRAGRIVWQWVPSFAPMRLQRYPFDYCPQLAELTPPTPTAVRPRDKRFFIDKHLYAFTLPEEHRIVVAPNGRKWQILNDLHMCRELLIPNEATLELDYGYDKDKIADIDLEVHFQATLRTLADGVERQLVDETFSTSSDDNWRGARISLADLAYQRIELCVSADPDRDLPGKDLNEIVLWASPLVHSADLDYSRPEGRVSDQLDEQQLKQLKAMGYVQ